ncbi:MaoC family dehydratase [Mycolicibacterium celeriflavum]|uniref:MaoC family dehydratase n=1 Tax=Mycolicibacterium celeriflavum TaxID=1249101 RepID=UPI003CF5D7B1
MKTSAGIQWAQVTVAADLPEVLDHIDYERVVMNAGATWDYFPAHYDPRYAERNGHPTIFVNTMHIAGFVDRVATDWAGPCARVVRRKITLLGSIYAGDSMVGRGRVVAKRDGRLVDLAITVSNQRGELCCPAEVTLQLSG